MIISFITSEEWLGFLFDERVIQLLQSQVVVYILLADPDYRYPAHYLYVYFVWTLLGDRPLFIEWLAVYITRKNYHVEYIIF